MVRGLKNIGFALLSICSATLHKLNVPNSPLNNSLNSFLISSQMSPVFTKLLS